MDKDTSEIAVLTGRIAKDPKSKLFVPLAEEYRKTGDLEMAVHVLLEGLKNNPDYVTARSSLGKFLLIKGDVAGAQKEFEEVVKAIPDNVLAHRKLGDIFIMQDRTSDALAHYKIALSFNPKDKELASLIVDVEAGKDVRSTIQPPKEQATAGPTVKQETPVSAHAGEPAPQPVAHQVSVEPEQPVEIPDVSRTEPAAPLEEVVHAQESLVMDTEEPEEVLVVQPLEAEISAPELPASGTDLPMEEREPVPSGEAENSFDFNFASGLPVPHESAVSEDILPETELIDIDDTEAIQPGVSSGETAADDIVEAEIVSAVSEDTREQPLDEGPELSDDFTTDTLAELYISQGFFEKAVEIYERMLADKPDSRGLQDKLAWVRAEAAKTAAPAAEQQGAPAVLDEQEVKESVPGIESGEAGAGPSVFDDWEQAPPQQEVIQADGKPEAVAEAVEYVPPVEPEEVVIEAEVLSEPGEFTPGALPREEDIFPESIEYTQTTAPEKQVTAAEDAEFDALAASFAQEQDRPNLKDTDFEPCEYVPPAAEQEMLTTETEEGLARPTSGIAGRKETIARLETWLTTIKKEK